MSCNQAGQTLEIWVNEGWSSFFSCHFGSRTLMWPASHSLEIQQLGSIRFRRMTKSIVGQCVDRENSVWYRHQTSLTGRNITCTMGMRQRGTLTPLHKLALCCNNFTIWGFFLIDSYVQYIFAVLWYPVWVICIWIYRPSDTYNSYRISQFY